MFCVLCVTNIGFVQCFSFSSRKVCYTLLLRFSKNFVLRVLFGNFCFACFASQTPGLCSAFPSAPVKFVACLCLTLLYSVFFCFACFASQTSCLCNALPSAPVVARSLLHAFVVSNLCFVLFASPTSGLCSAFPFGSPQVYTLLFFFV